MNCLLSPKRQTCTHNYANLSLSLCVKPSESLSFFLLLHSSYQKPQQPQPIKNSCCRSHKPLFAIPNLSPNPPLHRQEPRQKTQVHT